MDRKQIKAYLIGKWVAWFTVIKAFSMISWLLKEIEGSAIYTEKSISPCRTQPRFNPCLLWSHLRDYTFNRLSQFFSFILSYPIISDFEPWEDSLQELTYLVPFTISQTHVYLMVNLVLLNLTLFLTVHFRAVHGYAATHMCITHVLCVEGCAQ